jgi:hypothetical protein
MLVGNSGLEHGILMRSMEDQDRRSSLEALRDKDNWVVWKTKENKWTHELHYAGFHKLLSLDQNTTANRWSASAPSGAQDDIKNAILAPQQNYGKDDYTNGKDDCTIDLAGPEETYCLGTESGLLGAFHFDGACTAGDGSCDVASLSMGAGFCNLRSLK